MYLCLYFRRPEPCAPRRNFLYGRKARRSKKAGVAPATPDEAGNLSVYRKEKSPSARNRLQ